MKIEEKHVENADFFLLDPFDDPFLSVNIRDLIIRWNNYNSFVEQKQLF